MKVLIILQIKHVNLNIIVLLEVILMPLWNWICSGGRPSIKDCIKNLNDIMLQNDLVDIWRVRNSNKKRFTWRQKNPLIQRRLDFWLISNSLQDDIEMQTF